MTAKIRYSLTQIATVCFILGASFTIIAYGRGYRLDITKNSLQSTGLISATSDPIGAQIYVDGKLKTATNNSFNITPGTYQVTIAKEGFTSWQKTLRVQGEIVSRADAYLFPTNPSLSPLTTLGVRIPTLSPDGTKIAYIIPEKKLDATLRQKAGLWIYEVTEGPLGRNRDPQQIATTNESFDLEKSSLIWSPDSTHVLVTVGTVSRLYQLGRTNLYEDVTLRSPALLADWYKENQTKTIQQLEAFKQPIIDMATASAHIIALSPDETKILYEATASATIPNIINPPLIGTNPTKEMRTLTPGNIYVYDSKEDKNYLILEKSEIPKPTTPTPTAKTTQTKNIARTSPSFIRWFPTSRHLIVTLPNKIDIMEYDRTNWATIYSGPFVDGFVAPWSNGSRIIILTSINQGADALPNLYTVNVR